MYYSYDAKAHGQPVSHEAARMDLGQSLDARELLAGESVCLPWEPAYKFGDLVSQLKTYVAERVAETEIGQPMTFDQVRSEAETTQVMRVEFKTKAMLDELGDVDHLCATSLMNFILLNGNVREPDAVAASDGVVSAEWYEPRPCVMRFMKDGDVDFGVASLCYRAPGAMVRG